MSSKEEEARNVAGNVDLASEVRRLNTSVLTMRTMVNELITSHNELKDQVAALQQSQNAVSAVASLDLANLGGGGVLATLQQRETEQSNSILVKKERRMEVVDGTKTCHANEYKRIFAEQTCPPEFQSTDEEIDDIIARRNLTGEWPIRQKTYLAFSSNIELLKIRYHHSEKYQHIPVRITNTKGKDNRSRCKLCMSYNKKGSKGTGRNTSWMCSTCEVPLCVKCLVGEDNDIMTTHHARWHTKRDLVAENEICFEAVVSGRIESGKRKAESISLETEGEALPEVDGDHLVSNP